MWEAIHLVKQIRHSFESTHEPICEIRQKTVPMQRLWYEVKKLKMSLSFQLKAYFTWWNSYSKWYKLDGYLQKKVSSIAKTLSFHLLLFFSTFWSREKISQVEFFIVRKKVEKIESSINRSRKNLTLFYKNYFENF